MKSVFLCLSACIGFTVLSHAQFRKIPQEVTKAFQRKYPVAEQVAWKPHQALFQAAFSMFGIPFTADFSSDGNWQESAQDIRTDSLPPHVMNEFRDSRYADWRIRKAAFVVSPSAPAGYRLYIEKSGIHRKYLYFAADGRLEKEALTL